MNFRRKKREKLDITLISMIDVLFVLLLFFMVSTTFNRNTEVKVTLPEADGAEAEQTPRRHSAPPKHKAAIGFRKPRLRRPALDRR